MSSATNKPKDSGYAEKKPTDVPAPARDQPDPDAAGGEQAQVESHGLPSEDEPETEDDAPPGEHKREPIKDPDPADTKLHV